jgi:hypothetical protein
MKLSANAKEDGISSCNTILTKSEWESALQLSGKGAQFLKQAQNNFFLIASGLAGLWKADTDKALFDQIASVADDAESPLLATVIAEFTAGWMTMGQSDLLRSAELTNSYVTQNPNQVGSKHLYDYAPGIQEYHAAHKRHHQTFRETIVTKNYQDILFIDTRGNVVYTVNKDFDFGINVDPLGFGKYKTTGLGQAYQGALAAPDTVFDGRWQAYPTEDDPFANFLSKAITSEAGQVVGVYATQMPPEFKPIECQILLTGAINGFDQMLVNLERGVDLADIPPPPTESVATNLYALHDKWQATKVLLTGPASVEAVEMVLSKEVELLTAATNLDTEYLNRAWAANQEVPGTKIQMGNMQNMRIQKIAADIALMYMQADLLTIQAPTYEDILATQTAYEETQNILVNGQGVFAPATRRLAEDEIIALITDVRTSDDPTIVKLLADCASAYAALKTTLNPITFIPEGESEPIGTVTRELLRLTVGNVEELTSAVDQSLNFFASKIELIIREPISILAPMPLTGAWNAGLTMRTSAMLAQGILNDDQLVLPGYALTHVFFDDKCNPTVSSQTVLREMSGTINYIGLGGAGCTSVCRDTAFIAASVRLPFLSYECAGETLSDTSQYGDFTRMGTVTKLSAELVKSIGTQFAEWDYVEVVSGDPAIYRTEAEALVTSLQTQGLSTQYSNAFDTRWNEIVDLVDQLRINKRRQIFLLGTESYYRKIVCASIVVQANKGISWLSQGTWRDDWYKTSDALQDSYKQWVEEDAKKEDILLALEDFKKGWAAAGATDEDRYAFLQPIYVTESGELLESVPNIAEDGTEVVYHTHHAKYHQKMRDVVADRNYYDLFLLNPTGNLIYSVYKATDYATNFGTKTNLPEHMRKWQNSLLGEAFRAALLDQETLAATAWAPYGPTNGDMESFMAMTVKDADGAPSGVFAARMPPEAMSVEDSEPECTFETITAAFDGAINFVGLGQPLAANLGAQTPCFAGRTAESFLDLLDFHLKHGYPEGDELTKVAQPFDELKAHPADGTCVFAYTVAYLMNEEGYTMDQITSKIPEVYTKFVSYIKTQTDFQGVSGRVNFVGNDKPAYLAITQIQAGTKVLVGTCSHNGTQDLTVSGGPSNASWKPANPDPIAPEADFPYFVFQIVLPILCICCPALAACVRNF